MSRREEQKKQLSERFYLVALELFKSQGYEQTTMEQIANVVGVAKGTFFNHYKGKAAILVRWYHTVTMEALKETNKIPLIGVEQLQFLADALLNKAVEEPLLWSLKTRYVFSDLQLMSEERILDAEIRAFCVDIINKAKKLSQMPSNLDEKLFADLYLTTLTGTCHSWVIAQHRFDLHDVANNRLRFLFSAVNVNPKVKPSSVIEEYLAYE